MCCIHTFDFWPFWLWERVSVQIFGHLLVLLARFYAIMAYCNRGYHAMPKTNRLSLAELRSGALAPAVKQAWAELEQAIRAARAKRDGEAAK